MLLGACWWIRNVNRVLNVRAALGAVIQAIVEAIETRAPFFIDI